MDIRCRRCGVLLTELNWHKSLQSRGIRCCKACWRISMQPAKARHKRAKELRRQIAAGRAILESISGQRPT